MPFDFASLLPPFQPVALPSKGRYYKNIPALRDGTVYIREYSAQEEALLAHMNRENVQQVINAMLDSCMRLDGFKAEDLTTEDAFYLLVWLRANSYGATYDIEVTCPHPDCGREDTYGVNLPQLTVLYIEDSDPDEPIEVVAPKTKIRFEVNCMRRGTEVIAQKRAAQIKQIKGLYKGEISDLLKRAYSIKRVIMPNGEEITDRLPIEDLILKYLPAADSLVIDKAIESFKHGVDVNITLVCTSCNRNIFTVVPPGPEFFRPTRIRVENPGESARGDSPPEQVRQPGFIVSKDTNALPETQVIRHAPRNPEKGKSGERTGNESL